MKIKLFVNWENERILKKEEYEKEIIEAAKDREENDNYEFAEFLKDYLDEDCRCIMGEELAYLFNISEEDRKKILKLWKEDCLEVVRNNSDDYEEIEIEV